MINIFNNKLICIFLLLFSTRCIQAKTYVEVTNRLGRGMQLNLHCQSKDNDLGYHQLEDNESFIWSFNPNIWGGTLFYCDVQWADNKWFHFDAYDEDMDEPISRWMISDDGTLYGLVERAGYWESFPLVPSST